MNLIRCSSLIPAFLSGAAAICAAQATVAPVLTRAYDNNRTGWNQQETLLTQANVGTLGIVRMPSIPVFGDARGMEAQPLILPHVQLANGTFHDIMVLPSMANVVRGVDASDGAALWEVALGMPIVGSTPTGPLKLNQNDGCVGRYPTIDCHAINDKWGVLSTGVIDPDTKRVYMVAWISPDGTPQKATHYVVVLNVADGSYVVPLVPVAGTSESQTYSSFMRKQRSSLVMTKVNGHKTVFWASGTVQETGGGAAGWVFAFDCASNTISAALATSQGRGAGIWMGGEGLAADAQGYLYAVTGNGSFNGTTDFGESVIKIQYTPPGAGAASLKVADWWSPYSDSGREGKNPVATDAMEQSDKVAGMSAPSEAVRPVNAGMSMAQVKTRTVIKTTAAGKRIPLVFPVNPNDAGWNDEDLGSGGGALMEKIGVYVASGKDGIAYPVRTANMGKTMPPDFANPPLNCRKLAAPPVWFTESPGPVDPCPMNIQTLDFMPWGKTRHMHMTPIQYVSPVNGPMLFAWGENSQLHAWSVSPQGALTYLAEGALSASQNIFNTPGGMPGGFCTMSSNGNTAGTAVLWCTVPYGDANSALTNGILIAYDPDHFTTNPDKSKTLRVLWSSAQWGINFTFNKFDPPVVSGGQIYVPNYAGSVDIYRLAQPAN